VSVFQCCHYSLAYATLRSLAAMDADSLGAFERAAEGVQSGDAATRAAAETVLLALRESPAAVASSQAVLAQTSSAVAQFQALLALKEGVLREWGTTAPQQVDALRTQVRAVSATPSCAVLQTSAVALLCYLQAGVLSLPRVRTAARVYRGSMGHPGALRSQPASSASGADPQTRLAGRRR
jgi:hypothetical protein